MTEHFDGRCDMCHTDRQVKNTNIYTNGSEGTDLCYDCEILVMKYIMDFSNRVMWLKKDIWKKTKISFEKAAERMRGRIE